MDIKQLQKTSNKVSKMKKIKEVEQKRNETSKRKRIINQVIREALQQLPKIEKGIKEQAKKGKFHFLAEFGWYKREISSAIITKASNYFHKMNFKTEAEMSRGLAPYGCNSCYADLMISWHPSEKEGR